jgi:putative ABC transport system ATP-binding protein
VSDDHHESSNHLSSAVRTRGVTKTFGRGDNAVRALKGVDFDARCGEMVMIVGPSGCGKTTFLSVICGTMKADAGSVDVFGTDLIRLAAGKLTAFRGRNVGFVFQQFNLIPTWNILENASIPLLLQGQSRRKAQDTAARLLTEVGLGERLGAHPQQLSGGQQQRVAIARALAHEPRLLICDEPTAALDAATGHKILELLKASACREDRCVIVVTHDSRIFSFADRIAEMEDGVVKKIHDAGDYHAQYV